MDPDPAQEERSKPAALQLDLPGPAPRVAEAVPPAAKWSFARVRPGPRVAIALAVVALGALLIDRWIPGYLRRTCIEQAATHGITLAVDSVRLRTDGFALVDVHATASALPGASIEAPEVHVETRGLRPEKLTASGVTANLDGRWTALGSALDRWRASDAGGQGGDWAPDAVAIDGSRIVWHHPIGDNARVEAAGVHLDASWHDGQTTLHATSSLVTLDVPGGALGPWRVDLDREPGSLRARVALDPAVPDACTLLVVGNDDGISAADASIPRSPMARLGLQPSLFGLQGDVQVEASMHYVPFGPHGGAAVATKGGLYGVSLDQVPRPLDVAWELAASGDRGASDPNGRARAIDVSNARIAVGPLVGNARGTIKGFDDGFRVDLAWRGGPVPCAAFDAPLAPGQPFDIAYELRKLAQDTGLAKVHGDVSASATLAFDSRDLGAATLNFTPQVHCDVTIGH